jgi:hypothetical protein
MPQLLLAILWMTTAVAHEWYPPACCSGGDCAPIAGTRVRAMISGYVVDGRHIIPYGEVKTSQDGRFHACWPKPDQLRCFFAPPPAM